MQLRIACASIIVLLASASFEARAAVIFDETATGDQLAVAPFVTFPTVTPTVNGTSLDFGVGNASDILMRWRLLTAAPRGALHFQITIEYEDLSVDSDPRFGISDGSHWQGGSRTDQGFFTAQWATHDATTVTAEVWNSWCESLGAHVPSNPISWELDIADGGAGPATLTNYQEGGSSCANPATLGGNHLDSDQILSFLLYRDTVNGAEEYRIDSVSIVISDDASPPPSAPGLGPTSLALLIGILLGGMTGTARLQRRPDRR